MNPTLDLDRPADALRLVKAAQARVGPVREVDAGASGAVRSVLPTRNGAPVGGPSGLRPPVAFLALVGATLAGSVLVIVTVLLGGFR